MTKRETYEKRTEKLVQPILDELGFELVDVEYVKEGGDFFLRIYVDKEGGITVNDCAEVSRLMDPVLDEEDFVDDSYIFEVSSPGLGRPLKKERDFARSVGQEVEIRTYRALDGQKDFSGYLDEYTADAVTISDGDGGQRTFDRKDIALIRLAIRF